MARHKRSKEAVTPSPAEPRPQLKHRLEALSDGIYAIALTLLVLELKLPPLPHGASEQVLRSALIGLLPKGLTWLLSFWVMAMFWLAQLRLYRLSSALDWPMVWLEMLQLAGISLLPFSTALLGEHGGHVTAAAVYGANLVLIAWVSWLRTSHFLRHPELHAGGLPGPVARNLRIRAWVLSSCATAAFLLAFVRPGWNMLAMVPTALLPALART
jgi:uncharacterized membrane protein